MRLVERLKNKKEGSRVFEKETFVEHVRVNQAYQEAKTRIHFKILDSLNLKTVSQMTREKLESCVRNAVQSSVGEGSLALNLNEQKELIGDITNEIMGLGPIEP